ncbi:2OG-Fe(II) oxygenase [Nocardia nepalensis]|uniref:2OG-Fe(II) oxygenase n=1 Tax=Nocardia nepalensis TaxID=3375448 RepID=UPI003B675CF3
MLDSSAAPIVKVETGIAGAGATCFLLRGVLDATECTEIIDEATHSGFAPTGAHYPPSYRNNDRLVRDDPALADTLFTRIAEHLPARLRIDGADWRLIGLNERFRYCRYRGGQSFTTHRDGAHARTDTVVSRLTCMIYLNDGTEFDGGQTRFYASGEPDAASLGVVRPETGTIVVFDHALWHDGEPVTGGTKWVMRTDVLYEREQHAVSSPQILRGHDGYVWSVVSRPDGTLATASRDRTIRIWEPTADGYSPRSTLRGHDSSVVTLLAHPNGDLWSGSRDGAVCRWRSGQPVTAGHHDGAVLCATSLIDGRVVTGGADGHLRWWHEDGSPDGALAVGGWVWSVVSFGTQLISGSEDGTIRVCDANRLAATVQAPAPVRALAVTASGTVISGDADGWLRTWQLTPSRAHEQEIDGVSEGALKFAAPQEQQGAAAPTAPHEQTERATPTVPPKRTAQAIAPRAQTARKAHTGAVCAVTPLPGGRIASGGEDGAVRIWREADLAEVAAFHHDDFVRGLAVLSDGRLASASYDGTVRLWSPHRQ